MDYLQLMLLVAGLVALVIGYRKNNRNVLLAAALLLLASAALPDLTAGYIDGVRGIDKRAARALPGTG